MFDSRLCSSVFLRRQHARTSRGGVIGKRGGLRPRGLLALGVRLSLSGPTSREKRSDRSLSVTAPWGGGLRKQVPGSTPGCDAPPEGRTRPNAFFSSHTPSRMSRVIAVNDAVAGSSPARSTLGP